MNAGSMLIQTISDHSMVPEFRRFQLMPVLPVQTVTGQKEQEDAHTVITMPLIHPTVYLKNQLNNR